jgi:hypothetical protein
MCDPFFHEFRVIPSANRFRLVCYTELEFLKSLWGLGTEEEEGYRTGPPGYIGWRNSFVGIDSGPHTRLKIRALLLYLHQRLYATGLTLIGVLSTLGAREGHWAMIFK